MAIRSRCLRDALERFAAAAAGVASSWGTQLIGWRPPTQEEADEIYADLPEAFWQAEAA